MLRILLALLLAGLQGLGMPLQTPGGGWRVRSGFSRGGWTVFTPSTDTRIVYCSKSVGSDGRCGWVGELLDPNGQAWTNSTCPGAAGGWPHTETAHGPKQNLSGGSGAIAKLRSAPFGPDWLKLRCGDTWTEGFGSWAKSGVSASEKLLITSYVPTAGGTDVRPKIRTSGTNTNGFTLTSNHSHIALVDIDFENTTVPATGNQFGFYTTGTSDDILIEGCRFDHYNKNVITGDNGGLTTNVVVRRCVLSYGWLQGTYAQYIDGLTFDECVFYKNSIENNAQVVQRHHTYVDTEFTSNITFKNNLLDYAWSLGIQTRVGGTVTGNVVSRCGLGIQVGTAEYSNPASDATVAFNSVVSGIPPAWDANGSWALNVNNGKVVGVTDNIFANGPGQGKPVQFWKQSTGVTNATIAYERNILYQWGGITSPWNEGQVRITDDPSRYDSITFEDSDFYSTLDTANMIRWDNGGIDKVHSSGCRFHTIASASAWFNFGGDLTLSAFKTAQTPDDTTSTAPGSNFGYPSGAVYAPANATLDGYARSINLTNATADGVMAEAVKQRKGHWAPTFTAQAINAYMRDCFGL